MIKRRFELSGRDGIRWHNDAEKRAHRMRTFTLACGIFVFCVAFLGNYFGNNTSRFPILISLGVMLSFIQPSDYYYRQSILFTLGSLWTIIAYLSGVWLGYTLSGKSGVADQMKFDGNFHIILFAGMFALAWVIYFLRLRRKRKSRMG